ncbi:MAG: penicillin-binding protein 1C [Deltaproteobacteria bacterium]|nr:penicillin-binding protein 1C [Deltaproteobacteria bacterium]
MLRAAALAAAALAGAGALAAWLAVATMAVPAFDAIRARHRPSDVPLLDRRGTVLHELRTDADERRLAWTALADVSPVLVPAVLAAEDRRFRDHHGVDARALLGAALDGLAGRAGRGASTVTMQLAALLDPALAPRRGGRTLAQKLRQMRAALALERRWSKDEILEAYLNRVVFRGELRGVGAAAAFLFGKAPHGLDAAEALVLAAAVRSPNAARAAVVRRAARLAAARAVEVDGAALAAAADRVATAALRHGRLDLAPHLARRLLAGRTAPVATTLDAATQRVARGALVRTLTALRGRNVEDGAALVADNASGEVLAWVGGSGALSRARFVDAVRARRQPGSTLKPFLYGLAFERRLLTPASLVEDVPLAVAVPGGLYRPRDYDDRFRGLVSARTALASSLNVPAVRTLGLVGGDAFVALLHDLGFAAVTEEGAFYGPALALGGADVTLLELVGAYRALANGGVWSPLRVTPDAAPASAAPRRVLSAAAAFQVGDILADRESRSATFGLESALATRFFTAVKTGTSQDMRDNWCLGWSERYTVGVWVGNASGAPMHDVSGVAGAAPVWLEVMTWLHRAAPSAAPAPPPELVATEIAFPDDVEAARREWFAPGTEPGARVLAAGAARIVTPIDGTILALDPDIPSDLQRVPLDAAGGVDGLRWRVDGADLGPANALALWRPTPGAHVVALVDAAHATHARATVEVRGARRSPPASAPAGCGGALADAPPSMMSSPACRRPRS